MNLMVAIIYPIYSPLFYLDGLGLQNIAAPEYYDTPNFMVLKILHYIVVGLYSLYVVFLFIPKIAFLRVIFDSGVIGMMLFIIIQAFTYNTALYFPLDLRYSIAIAFLTLGVAIFQLANYFISKRLVHHKEKMMQAGVDPID